MSPLHRYKDPLMLNPMLDLDTGLFSPPPSSPPLDDAYLALSPFESPFISPRRDEYTCSASQQPFTDIVNTIEEARTTPALAYAQLPRRSGRSGTQTNAGQQALQPFPTTGGTYPPCVRGGTTVPTARFINQVVHREDYEEAGVEQDSGNDENPKKKKSKKNAKRQSNKKMDVEFRTYTNAELPSVHAHANHAIQQMASVCNAQSNGQGVIDVMSSILRGNDWAEEIVAFADTDLKNLAARCARSKELDAGSVFVSMISEMQFAARVHR